MVHVTKKLIILSINTLFISDYINHIGPLKYLTMASPYHVSIEEYKSAEKKIFTEDECSKIDYIERCIVNIDNMRKGLVKYNEVYRNIYIVVGAGKDKAEKLYEIIENIIIQRCIKIANRLESLDKTTMVSNLLDIYHIFIRQVYYKSLVLTYLDKIYISREHDNKRLTNILNIQGFLKYVLKNSKIRNLIGNFVTRNKGI